MNSKEAIQELITYGKAINVLYVEDDLLVQKHMHGILSTIFAVVDICSNGKEGWNAYQSQNYDLVITDLLMPQMNGLELIKRIKSENPVQKIIVLSACQDKNELHHMSLLGVDEFIAKPMEINTLITAFSKIVRNIRETVQQHE